MKRLLFLLILSCTISIASGQEIDKRIEQFVSIHKTDTFLIYSVPCNGGMLFDTCQEEVPHYLFWVEKGKYLLTKFTYCNDLQATSIDSSGVLPFYFSNAHTINAERIKPPSHYEVRKTKTGYDTLLVSTSVDHSCYHELTIHNKGNIVKKSADDFFLDFVKFDNGQRNINYRHNQRTKLKALIDMIESRIKAAN
jgi:hypothetical protein